MSYDKNDFFILYKVFQLKMEKLPTELLEKIMFYYVDVLHSMNIIFNLPTLSGEKGMKRIQDNLIKKVFYKDGSMRYILKGTELIHRYDDPAAIGISGTKYG